MRTKIWGSSCTATYLRINYHNDVLASGFPLSLGALLELYPQQHFHRSAHQFHVKKPRNEAHEKLLLQFPWLQDFMQRSSHRSASAQSQNERQSVHEETAELTDEDVQDIWDLFTETRADWSLEGQAGVRTLSLNFGAALGR
eukprot:6486758-Amphidinium_carterae.1